MRILFIFMAVFFISIPASRANSIDEIIDTNTIFSPQIKAGRPYWLEVSENSNFSFAQVGLQLEIGRRWKYFGTDIRLVYAKTNYSNIEGLSGVNVDLYVVLYNELRWFG